jgi:serine/threonine-protein kinase HipA
VTELAVVIGGAIAGSIKRSENGTLRFDYAETYRTQADPTPLSLSLPPVIASHADTTRRKPVANFLDGLLPEDPDVRQRWAQHYGVRPNPMDLLGTPVGEDCAGAVALVLPEHVERYLSRRGSVRWLTEAQVGERMRDLEADEAAWSGRDFTGRFSLAGAQAKTALLRRNGRWGVPTGPIPTTHILKPGARRFADHALNEHLCLDAARRVGLLVARTRISNFGGQIAVVVERYDRVVAKTITRRHQEDVVQALGLPPSAKYQSEGGPSPETIVALFDKVMPKPIAEESRQRFLDALAWNWIIGGTDGHAKNYSLLLHGSAVRLAPLYDISSALPYIAHERRARLAMKVGGSYELYVGGRNRWPQAATQLGLAQSAVAARVKQLALNAPEAFAEAAADRDVLLMSRSLTDSLVELVSDRAKRCAALL